MMRLSLILLLFLHTPGLTHACENDKLSLELGIGGHPEVQDKPEVALPNPIGTVRVKGLVFDTQTANIYIELEHKSSITIYEKGYGMNLINTIIKF